MALTDILINWMSLEIYFSISNIEIHKIYTKIRPFALSFMDREKNIKEENHMAVVGAASMQTESAPQSLNRFYSRDPMHGLAEQFAGIAEAGRQEGVEIFSEPSKFFMTPSLKRQMKNFFVNESYDPKDPSMQSREAIQEHVDNYGQLFENDMKCLMEAAPLGAMNPVVGLTFPMHKNLLMTTIFDKGAIPKDVAAAPTFTLTMETRTLVAPDGREIDMFLQQDQIKDVVESAVPRKDIVITLPEDQSTNVLQLLGATSNIEHISRSTRVTKLIISGVDYQKGEEYYDEATKTIKVADTAGTGDAVIAVEPIRFAASYGQYDRTFQKRIAIRVVKAGVETEEQFQIAGSMHKDKFTFLCSSADVKAVVLSATLDMSTAVYETPKVKWSARSDFFEIPDAPHITVTISPEETRDIQAMYNVNQLTKLLSMMKLTLVNYKDDKILEKLDESWENLPTTSKISGIFDFVPENNYMGSHVAWRYETFMDYFDLKTTYMLQVLNDENVTFTIFGSPALIRRLTPTNYNYATPSNIGPVMLDYKKTITTSDNRVYQFVSSNKLRNDNTLIVILNPRNSTRVMYKIFDYQMYVGNEIRDTVNYQLPAVTAFERWLMISYQPVQGRIRCVNVSGLQHEPDSADQSFVSDKRALNEYSSMDHDYDRENKKYLETHGLPGAAHSVINPSEIAPGQHVDIHNEKYAYAPDYAVTDPDPKNKSKG